MSPITLKQRIQEKFTELFHAKADFFKAPGRINLIGEHTDYNEGFVLPAAIDKHILFGIQKNDLRIFRFYSIDYKEYQEFDRIELVKDSPFWSRYLLGVLAQFKKKNLYLSGFDCVFGGDIPLGAGLSSSAALECGFAFGINHLSNFEIPSLEIVKMAQKAEHEYTGVMCGIMDQYASVFGTKDQVFMLDCRTNTHEYFPFKMDDFILALVNTHVKHSLASSEYNLRQEECNKGVKYFQNLDNNIQSLRDVPLQMIEEDKNKPDTISYNRCKYVVEENERVKKATQALNNKDYLLFGQFMYQSHEGLQKLYEVSCKELDFLVEQTKAMDKVLGSRMMGGGFGGCTLNLLKKPFAAKFEKEIKQKYKEEFGIEADIYFVKISDGTSKVIVEL